MQVTFFFTDGHLLTAAFRTLVH